MSPPLSDCGVSLAGAHRLSPLLFFARFVLLKTLPAAKVKGFIIERGPEGFALRDVFAAARVLNQILAFERSGRRGETVFPPGDGGRKVPDEKKNQEKQNG
jgi:hypothetical protein